MTSHDPKLDYTLPASSGSEETAQAPDAAELIGRIERYLAWDNSPQFDPCPHCNGKGYHHGFGEHGHDPDWCLACGGPGLQPTEPGTWSPDDLLSEALALLKLAAPAPQGGR